jgi:hypothetical protein
LRDHDPPHRVTALPDLLVDPCFVVAVDELHPGMQASIAPSAAERTRWRDLDVSAASVSAGNGSLLLELAKLLWWNNHHLGGT